MAQLILRLKELIAETKAYWNCPRSGEYVPYKEVLMLSIGVMGMRMSTIFSISFGSGNAFTGYTLGMDNIHLVIIGYITGYISYGTTTFNSFLLDNHRMKGGKFRPFIRWGYVSCALAVFGLWMPWQRMPYWVMVIFLFVVGQVQGYIQEWFSKGSQGILNVITPNTQERSKLISIYSIISNIAPTLVNLFRPMIAGVVSDTEYSAAAYRCSYTPFIIIGLPLAMFAYYGTKERMVMPRSRITKVGFIESFREVAHNKIFWIKCFDGWNDFLESAKGTMWSWMVNYRKVCSLPMKGVIDTLVANASLWNFLFMPSLIKRFGKKKIKIFKNVMQIFLIAALRPVYQKYLIIWVIIIWIDRFIDTSSVIDSAIDADMRDQQQYLSGDRIDGPFDVVKTITSAAIGQVTGLYMPWVFNKYGLSYKNTNYALLKNTEVLYPLINVLIKISFVGAIIDCIPWFFYDLTETDQKSVVRVNRIRTLVEDYGSLLMDKGQFIDGCDAVIRAREHFEKTPLPVSKGCINAAKALPKTSAEEKQLRYEAIKAAKKEYNNVLEYNEEITVAQFVMGELDKFKTQTGKAQLEVARAVTEKGLSHFQECYGYALKSAYNLPTDTKKERHERGNQIYFAKSLRSSTKKISRYYKDGLVPYDEAALEEAENMPEATKEEAKAKRRAIKLAAAEKNRYASVAKPYLKAQRVINLEAGYSRIDEILLSYDEIKRSYDADRRHEKEEEEARKAEREAKRNSLLGG